MDQPQRGVEFHDPCSTCLRVLVIARHIRLKLLSQKLRWLFRWRVSQ